ncbi:Putative uncharacterized protein [Taphrina deformans PYCC 5710]|uniref:Uncharacterized protein n=1 Tax=Taphrina deformans (strain PYCC 5710 / ATCC 11124 / CBS 356.35 / IMI 108563 / JCM 9778 / NBRC 8474) TaxID=1097556 RepID=R4X733_TAPDE|nr:Putative uncharacterized protein [Taphrina deformans PYCC 5710]|eukprot:CCG81051.1 Putative uncharacterized protein [Taphrina deformans PYCC 5710]
MAPVADTQLYDILGISPEAGAPDIKKAYHNLVRREHPDKKPEEEREEAAERFREIQEAYDILREPETRAQYDEMGLDGMAGRGAGGGSGMPGGMDMDDLFAQMFGGGMGGPPGRHPPRRTPRKQNVEHEYPVSLEDLYRGKSTKMKGTRNKICPHCTGSGCRSNHSPSKCPSCDGKGSKTASMMVGPGMYSQQQVECPSCEGSGKTIKDKDRCRKCKGKKVVDEVKIMEVFIDRGMADGEQVVLTGQADEVPGGEAGDVVITLAQRPHDVFTRLGSDLKADLTITLAESLCGFSRVVVNHLDGRRLTYASPVGKVMRPGETIVVKGEGMPVGHRREGFGDLYLLVRVDFPEDNFLSEKGEYGRLSGLLPQKQIRVPESTAASPLTEPMEEDIQGVTGNIDDFGGDAKVNGSDWTDDEEDEAEPGVQCNQQ